MLRIFVPVTLNPGWVWVIFIKFDFKEKKREEDLRPVKDSSSSVRGETNKARHLSSKIVRLTAKGAAEGSALRLRQKGFHKFLHCS